MCMACSEAQREELLASTEGNTDNIVHYDLPPFFLPKRFGMVC